MKYINIPILILALLMAACTNKGDRDYKTLMSTDMSDFHVYAGSLSGGQQVTYPDDSIRNTALRTYFGGSYLATDLYKNISFEFFEDKITYIYTLSNGSIRQIISNYEFKNDSLYVQTSDGGWLPAAPGNQDSLYHTVALYRLKIAPKDTTFRHEKSITNLDSVLKYSGYTNISQLGINDTIMWANVKYIYKNK